MTRDDIIRMAREAGIYTDNMLSSAIIGDSQLERFAALVAAAEREACAKVADAEAARWEKNSDGQVSVQGVAAAIRARGQQ